MGSGGLGSGGVGEVGGIGIEGLGSERLGSEGLGSGGWVRRGWGRGVGGVGVGVREVGVEVGGLGSEGLGSRGLGSGGVGEVEGVGVGKVVVLASNSPRIKSSSRQIVMYPWANGTCLGPMGMWGLEQMSVWEIRHFGIDEHWGKIWALGENEHQEKLVPGQTSRLFAANEHFGPNGHFGNVEHWGWWALGRNGH